MTEFTQEQARKMYQALNRILSVRACNTFRGLKRLLEAVLEAKRVVKWVEQDTGRPEEIRSEA